MNVIAWLMFGNMALICITLWTLYEAKLLADCLEDMHISYCGRINNLIEKLMDLSERKHDKSETPK